uniref:Putative secreted peptide n=1 Tax=Anopheles braziliensis TaxID=58242 RepID=A0A2M3ZVZ0_9DIPT
MLLLLLLLLLMRILFCVMIRTEATVIVGEALRLDVSGKTSKDRIEIEVRGRRRGFRSVRILPQHPGLRCSV